VANTFLNPSKLPYGLPDFANIVASDYEDGILLGIETATKELARVANDDEAPTVDNTLRPIELLEGELRRLVAPFFQILWADGTDEIEEINLRIAPKIAAAQDELLMNRAIYDRLVVLDNTGGHDAATTFLIKNWLKRMRRAGVLLNDDDAARLRSINAEITELQAKFGQLLIAGNNAAAVLLSDAQELAGLDDEAIAAYASAAADQGLDGYLISLELTSGQQILSRLANPELRARIMAASLGRGSDGGENDTTAVLSQIAKLRAEHAQLLGFANHAAYVADNGVIETPEAVAELLGQLAAPAMANTRREATQLAEEYSGPPFELGTPGCCIEFPCKPDHVTETLPHHPEAPVITADELPASDWAFLTEQLLRDKFNFDFEQLRPYLELQSVLHNGVFKAAHELYGLNFVERPDLHGYHDDVVVYEVFDDDKPQTPNEGRGLVMFDFYARPTKRGGAWMNPIVPQNYLMDQKPVVTQTLNLVKPAATANGANENGNNEPTLITWTNVITLFHEFGHALHGLLSDAYWPGQSMVNVPTDFVEYPSQINEMWARDPQILAAYAKHYETGEPMPTQWYEHLKDAREFGEGFALTEILGANAIDQAFHRLTPSEVPDAEQVMEFEKQALIAAGVYLPAVPPRYRAPYYNHIWSSGYSAGYYSYMLSKMFDADTVQWFKENGGLTRENGRKFAAEILSQGFMRDAKESFRALRGRDVAIEPLLTRLGLS